MKLAERTFRRKDYVLTSKFGYRKVINTSAGATNSFHSGADYGTHGEKWAQYALEDGIVSSVYTDSYGAKCVVIDYVRIGKKLYYCHLDKICVKKNQKVNHDTILGYTGATGRANGIHLHLCLKNINGKDFLDPEKYDYIEAKKTSNNFLGTRGYLKYGDKGSNINKICLFFANTFYGYFGNTKESARIKLVGKNGTGDFFGENLKAWVKEFQTRTGLEPDGNIGPLTLAMLKKYGFNY